MKYFLQMLVILISVSMGVSQAQVSTSQPTGTSVSLSPSSGTAIGNSGGKTYSISNSSWPTYSSSCYTYGLPTTIEDVINGYNPSATCSGLQDLTFDASASNLSSGIAVFTGTTTYKYKNTSFNYVTNSSISVRLTATFTSNSSALEASKVGNYILVPAKDDFKMHVLLEAYSPSGASYISGSAGSWTPAITLFDNLHTDPASKICTSFSGGNWYSVSTTASASNTGPYSIGNTIALSASGGNSYSWSGPNSYSSVIQNPSITSATTLMQGTYTVTVYGDVACPATANTTVIVGNQEIKVLGNNTEIVNGDITPSTSDHTDFGCTQVSGGDVSRTFTIENTGTNALSLTGTPRVKVTGTNAADFTVITQPSSSSVAASSTSTFVVKFDPSAGGTRTATISIANDDANENPYTFNISGYGSTGIVVNSSANSGAGTLRQAIADACEGDEITFSGVSTISLTSSLSISKSLVINGGTGVTIQRNTTATNFRVFEINSTGDVTLKYLTIKNGLLTGVDDGAGVHASSDIIVENCVFENNIATDDGGAIYMEPSTNLTLTNSIISSNKASWGGGVYVRGIGTISNCEFSGNSATTDAGALRVGTSAGVATVVTNCTFNNNTAESDAGAVGVTEGTLNMINCTVIGNTAVNGIGGGIQKDVNTSVLTIQNCLVADNINSKGKPDLGGAITSNGYNIIGNRGTQPFVSVSNDQVGTNSNPIDVKVGSLTNNGGFTKTIPILAGSPALNSGTSTGTPTTDQRGFNRVGNTDIGAYEFQGSTVLLVTSNKPNGIYTTGDIIPIQVVFSGNVTVTGTPQLELETGAVDRKINYTSGSGTDTLVFNYTVQLGDENTDLELTSTTALNLNGGTIKSNGHNSYNILPDLGDVGSLSYLKDISIQAGQPKVINITSTTPNGKYKAGDVINVQVKFDKQVNVTGTPQIQLETGTIDRIINYSSGSSTATLEFNYTIQPNDESSDLDLLSNAALTLNSGTIKSNNGVNAILTLPNPGASNSLADNKDLVVDTKQPLITQVSSSTANGTYIYNDVILIDVSFDEVVTVTGTPQLELETGTTDRLADYISGSGTKTLTFKYTVQANDESSDLAYTSNAALSLNSGTILDAASNAANLQLPNPGNTNSLSANKALVIYTQPEINLKLGTTTYLSGGTYDYGNLNVGSMSTVTFTIENNGGNTLSIGTPITLASSSHYTVSAVQPSSNISPNGTATFTVSFTPTTTGTLTNKITISSNDADESSYVINLKGTGQSTLVSSFNRSNPVGYPTNLNALGFRLKFAANVSNVSSTNFQIKTTGTASASINSISAANNTASDDEWDIELNSVSGNGNIWLELINQGTISIHLSNIPFASQKYRIDKIVPTITSINRNNPTDANTNATSVVYRFSPSEHLLNVDASDFELTTTGTASGSISSVSQVGTTANYDITVNSVSGDGKLRLDLKTTHNLSDSAGNVVSGGYTSGQEYIIDNSNPSKPIIAGITTDSGNSSSDGITNDQNIVISGTAEANSTVKLYLGTNLIGTITADVSGNWSLDYTATTLAEGSYSLTATATDAAANTSSVSSAFSITIDTSITTPSTPDMLASSDSGSSDTDNETNDNTPSFSGTAEANSKVELFEGSNSLGLTIASSTGTWSITSSSLSDGNYTITAKSTDAAGNVSSSSAGLSIKIDTSKPTAPSTPDLLATSDSGSSDTDNETNDNTPSFSGTAEANSKVELFASSTSIGSTTTSGTGAWTITSSSLADGNYTITAKSSDVAGNVSSASSGLSIKIDTSKPSAPSTPDMLASSDSGSSDTDNETSDNTPSFSGTAEANSKVELFAGATSIGSTTASSTGAWTITSSSLADGSYTITAKSSDAAGNVSLPSAGLSIKIDASSPSAPSTPDMLASSDSGTSDTDNETNDATPSFSGTAEANSKVELFAGSTSIGTTTASGTGVWNITSSSLSDGTYSITAKATDASGNISNASGSLSIVIDTKSPTVLAVSSTKANGVYGPTTVIPITVSLSEKTIVTGSPYIELETGTTDRKVSYSSGSNSTTLTFNYTVSTGDESSDLDYTSNNALVLNSGTINDVAGNNAVLTLANPAASNSLSSNKNIAVRDPEIKIVQNAININSGNTVDFGRININTTKELSFTLENTGSTPLQITTPISITGSGYTITQQPSSSVAASSNTTFKIKFAPTTNGLTQGAVTIANNDIDESSFVINLDASSYTIDKNDSSMLCLDGVDDYVEISNEAAFDLTSNFSIETWVKVESFSKNNQAIISKGNAWAITRDGTTNQIKFTANGLATNTSVSSTTSVNDGLWHHIAAVYNGSKLLLYIDGELDGSATATGNVTSNNSKVQIGAQSGTNTFHGSIEELRIWNSVISQTSIQEGMNVSGDHDFNNLLAYYQFNGASSTIVDNSSGFNGSLMNGATKCTSTAPVGEATVYTVVFNNTTGTKAATGTGLEFTMTSISGDIAFVVSKMQGVANGAQVTGPKATCNDQYWIVRPYTLSGAGTYNLDLCFEMDGCAIAGLDQFNPNNLKMYKRHEGSAGSWSLTNSAFSASAANDDVCFSGITSFSQITIGTTGLSFIPGAEIEVLDASSNNVADGSTQTFGNTNVGQNTDRTFTIRNLGTTNLIMTTPFVATGDYSIISQPTSIPAPANSTTFTIRFTPTTTGNRTGSLAFVNNDLDENPFNIDFKGLGIRPVVNNVTASNVNGTYILGQTIDIEVEFSQAVTVTGTPQIEIETGATDRLVNYSSGSGTNTLVFKYTVQSGDHSTDLNYTSINALSLNGGTIKNGVTDATLTLPTLNGGNSLADNKNLVIDGVQPVVTNVNSLASNGSYRQNDVIAIIVSFDDNVFVTGTPQLELETGATDQKVDYSSGSNSKNLTFYYTVQAADVSADLDYTSANALLLNSGAIKDVNGNPAILTLANPGAAKSLGNNKDIVIDNSGPAVTSVSSTTSNGSYKAGSTINVTVTFDEKVFVTNTPQIELETGTTDRNANYTSGSGSKVLSFTYTVQAGDISSDLDYTSANALALNSGTLKDAAGNNAILTLANPGAANSLSANKNIIIDTDAPNAPSIAAITNDSGNSNNDGLTNDQNLVLNGTAEMNSTVTIYRDGASVGTTTASNTGAWTFDYTTATLSEGKYVFTAKATDAANNQSIASSDFDVEIDITAPNKPSTPDLLATSDSGNSNTDNNTNDNTPSFSGTAEANSKVELFAGATSIGTTTASNTGAWTITSSNLLDGTYLITAKSTDAAGNVSSSSNSLSVVIDTDSPNQPSTPDLLATSDSGNSNTDNNTNDNTPSFSGTAEANSKVELFAGAISIGTTTASNTGAWTITSSNLLDGTYLITAKSTDIAGNVSSSSNSLSVVIDTDSPNQPSTPDLLATSDSGASNTDNNTNDNTPSFSGTAEANSKVELFAGATSIGTTTASNTGAWTITSSNLSDGTYLITSKSTDIAGNVSSSSNSLSVVIDTKAPASPVLASISTDSGNSSSDEITNDQTLMLSGTAEANSSVQMKLAGNNIGAAVSANGSGNFSFDYTGTTLAEGNYTFSAQATDLAGNVSANATNFPVTIDLTNATITSVSSSNSNGTYNQGSTITITVNFSEAVYVSGKPEITLETGANDGKAVYSSGSGTSTLSFVYTVASQHTTADLEYVNTSALSLNGGSIDDVAGNNATLSLPATSSGNSLSDNKAIVINASPTLSSLSPVSICQPYYTASQNFTMNDIDDAITALSITASSSNTTLVSNSNIELTGTGATRAIRVKPSFGQSGTSTISVKITDANGASVTNTYLVTVHPKPEANFTVNDTCQADMSNFVNTSTVASGTIVSNSWTFGDGNSSTATSPKHLYSNAGTYTVSLITTSNNGCIDTFSRSHTVYPKPEAMYSTTLGCEDKAVQFYDSTTVLTGSIKTYNWSFGNSGTSTQTNPSNVYTKTGTYNTSLIVTSDKNCIDTMLMAVEVNPNPTAKFSTSNVCVTDTAMFVNQSTISAGSNSYNWNFGDSIVSTSTNPSHLYTVAGHYSVQLVATSAKGCQDSISNNIQIYATPEANFVANNECDEDSVSFVNQTTGATSYEWNFADASAANTLSNPTHLFPKAGKYNVRLVASSKFACKDTTYQTVTIHELPVPAFTASTECLSDSTVFTNNSTNATAYTWDFGDGTSSSNQAPKHLYGAAGTYTVQLVAQSSKGCLDTTSQTITVYPNPTVAFTVSDECDQDAISTNNLSTISSGSISNYEWTLGDGVGTSTSTNASYTYANAGTYTIQLVAESNNGCKDSTTNSVTINPNPVAAWTAANECDEDAIEFNNSSSITSGSFTSEWTFGDAIGTSNNTSPTYTYATYGTYNVELTLTSDKGCTDQLSKNVTVYQNPTADFATNNVCFGDSLMIVNNSKLNANNLWSFGDGSTSNAISKNHFYAKDGNYNIGLLVTSADGCTDTTFTTVSIYKKPIAQFTNDSICDGAAISFNNTSYYGNIANNSWSFGDGNTSQLVSPQHQYASNGTYTAQLIVTTDDGCMDTISHDATVFPNPIPSFTQADICVYDSMEFVNTSSIATGSNQYEWSFGDGATSTRVNPSHQYASQGKYEVTLKATSNKACIAEVSQFIEVYEVPTASFAVDPNCYGDTTYYINNSTINNGSLTKYEWSFGDGNNSLDQDAKHLFAASGLYNTQLVVSSNNACTDTVVNKVTIWKKPVADFIADAVCHLSVTEFINISSDAVNSQWNFGDGSGSSIIENPSYTYMNPGTYTVNLQVGSVDGCRDTIEKQVVVHELPLANFELENHCYGEAFEPNNTSTGNISDYLWYFGDGNTSTDENPSYVYGKDGTYIVSLVVTSAEGCTDSVARELIVHPLPVMDISADTTLKRGYTTELMASGGVEYSWTPTEWLSNPDIANPIVTAVDVVEYTVTITTEFGCADDTTVTISSDNDYTLEPMNIITPNGNGKNDYWIVDKATFYNDVEVIVFDRWGRKVFADKAYKNNWDGTVNGDPLPEGTYYYIIKLPTEREEYKGFITIFK